MRVGLPWIEAGDWERFVAVMSDRPSLHSSHAEWLIDALSKERMLLREGHDVHRIPIKPDVFLTWCTIRGLSPGGPSRSRYAAEILRDKSERSGTV
jgi:hypothetical protein